MRERAHDILVHGLLFVETLRIDQSLALHLAKIVDQSANDACLRRIAPVEGRRIGKEQGVVQGAGEDSAYERGHVLARLTVCKEWVMAMRWAFQGRCWTFP